MGLRSSGALLSQLYHFAVFSLDKRRNQLRKAALVISVDVDVGCKLVGERNQNWRARARAKGERIHDRFSESKVGEIEEIALPCLLHLFEEFEVPVTFAIPGQLTETEGSLYELIKRSSIKHDIAAHGYYHRTFTSLSRSEAESELEKISIGMSKFKLEPKSFVFPKNKIDYLDLLERYGYKCYRGYGEFRNDSMNISRHGNLYNVHPSFFVGSSLYSLCINEIVDIAIKHKNPFHVWFHPWDLGGNVQSINRRIAHLLRPMLTYAHRKRQDEDLSIETMLSIVEKIEKQKWGTENIAKTKGA
jgi:peptidoglycan/xylan/chitin deacetylase (PgdA/CDA1 family)